LTSENAGRKEAAAARVHIATAHHADDNAETVLFNLFRGSGLTGLSGIAPVRGRIIRPLLWAQRSEIQTWLRQQGQDWVEDSTNQESEYSRNWLRNELLPAVEERLNAQAVRHIDQAGRRIWKRWQKNGFKSMHRTEGRMQERWQNRRRLCRVISCGGCF